jgi:hypothetical protein
MIETCLAEPTANANFGSPRLPLSKTLDCAMEAAPVPLRITRLRTLHLPAQSLAHG